MTPKEKYRRVDAYARASKRVTDWFRADLSPWLRHIMLEYFRRHERHAWARLPENLRKVIQP